MAERFWGEFFRRKKKMRENDFNSFLPSAVKEKKKVRKAFRDFYLFDVF